RQVHRRIVHDENALTAKDGRRLRGRLFSGHRQAQLDEEGRSNSLLALDPDASAKELDQLAADGEPKAPAAVLAGRGAGGLGETREDSDLGFVRDSDACVSHGESNGSFGIGLSEDFDLDRDAALLSELDGVSKKVDQNLAEPDGISYEHRQRRVDVAHDLQAL